jgi:hypothetical protein
VASGGFLLIFLANAGPASSQDNPFVHTTTRRKHFESVVAGCVRSNNNQEPSLLLTTVTRKIFESASEERVGNHAVDN